MTKNEAISKIKELQEFVNSIPENKHPEYKKGQVYRHKCGSLFVIRPDRKSFNLSVIDLMCVYSTFHGGVGNFYSHALGFDGDEKDFKYIGMFEEVFKCVVS